MERFSPSSLYVALEQWALDDADALWLDDPTTPLTTGAGLHLVRQFAELALSRGVRAGDLVALDLPTVLGYVAVVGLNAIGAVSLQYPRLASSTPVRAASLWSTRHDSSPFAERCVVVDQSLLAAMDQLVGVVSPQPPEPDSLTRVIFTSGTTGTPKGIGLSMQDLYRRRATMTAIRRSGEREFYATGVDTVAGFRAFFAHLVERSPFLTPGDIPHTVLQIQRRPLDYWATSPVLAEACVDVLAQRDPPRISRISLTGSRVSSEALARITSTFRSEVIIAYGSTEGGLLAQDVGRHDDPTYVGVIEAHLDLQVVDEHDHEVPVGTIGIIRYRHDAMPTSYLNDTDASVRAFRNGWFYPGDLGVVDDERRLRITGRLDELVNVGGTKVDPGTLDDVRLHVVGIEDAAGCGIRHDDGTVVLALAIVTNKTFVMGDLQTYLTREFGIAKPQIIATVPSIPRNAMGKVARADLALQLKDIVARD